MIRAVSTLAIVLLVASSFGLYKLKYSVQRLDRQTRNLQASIDQERQNIQVLEAEWTYLNQPQRIQELATRFLQLKPAQPGQIASLDDIPSKMPAPREEEPHLAARTVSSPRPAAPRHDGFIAPTLATVRAPASAGAR